MYPKLKYFIKAADYCFSKTQLWEDEEIGWCVCGLKKRFSYAFYGCSKELLKWHTDLMAVLEKVALHWGLGMAMVS